MKKWEKHYLMIAGLICIAGFTVLHLNLYRVKETEHLYIFSEIERCAEQLYCPNLLFQSKVNEEENFQQRLSKKIMNMIPLGNYIVQLEKDEIKTEDEETCALLMQMQEADESAISREGALIGEDSTAKTLQAQVPSEALTLDKLRNMDYLVSHFYTVDSVTYLNDGELNAEQMLTKDLHIDFENSGPKVLIFHTHSQEAFIDSDGTSATSIVGAGTYLSDKIIK